MENEIDIHDLYAGFEDCINYFATETLTRTPSFNAVQIHRPSNCFHGVLNIAAAVFDLSDFAILNKIPVVSFCDMMGKENHESKPCRGKVNCDGSKWSEQSYNVESYELSSLDLLDGTDSTTSSLSILS
ncbi:Uncharacterized protein Adt_33790 [Abeliophyllum distichum]|uniref:Uncharacterized protein n=1 Tax=Abeliophyllum distichum TaxID=126358 RepID=A0ABD1QY67_9LAMI